MLAGCLQLAAVAGEPPLPTSAPSEQGYSAARLQRLHDFMGKTTDAHGYLGGVTLIARNGRIVDWRAYGYRDLARSRPLQRDDIFRIYSMSKTVTSVAVLMLMEEGRFALDDPISRYLPGFEAQQVVAGGSVDRPQLRAPARPITIRHLLTHTAGFAAGRPGDEVALALLQRADPHAATDLRGFVQRLSAVPLAADPGTRFGYDGAALETLARLVEVGSGLSFDEFLQRRVFAPLRMRDTGFSVPAAQRERVVDITVMGADGRLHLDDGPSASEPGAPLNAYPSGAGGLYSTAGDYARFCQMLLNGGSLDGETLLGRKTVELMLRNHLTMLSPPVTQFSDAEGFGLGGYVVLDPALRGQPGSVGQFGWSGAASTSYTIDPQERLLAILLLQHLPREDRADLPRVSRPFYGLVYQGLTP
ncbi:beta-lactamase family protein [Lysobacter sp. 5GHs7-4]|uniref:serine hydrolase domain-containing protein n=1 Tax=Lysobacter sp. 5GHs7-4 TaxID=2904253 RepID=UPI001E50FA54|nr:serine hydrolase domain-containing protein [Lysobacter sp. 5GHs7-4]UHQ22205.1 beta-lactamase family protein [Lysobacter sp. 5GHs7-4]